MIMRIVLPGLTDMVACELSEISLTPTSRSGRLRERGADPFVRAAQNPPFYPGRK